MFSLWGFFDTAVPYFSCIKYLLWSKDAAVMFFTGELKLVEIKRSSKKGKLLWWNFRALLSLCFFSDLQNEEYFQILKKHMQSVFQDEQNFIEIMGGKKYNLFVRNTIFGVTMRLKGL